MATGFFPAREVKNPDFSSFTSFDIETTGLARTSEIIEIGAVKVKDGKICDSFCELIKPDAPIPYNITLITGITNDMVKNADSARNVISRFVEFTGDDILLGHNAVNFDCKIMGFWAEKYSIHIDCDVFDTLRYIKYRCEPMPGLANHKLSSLCDYFGVKPTVFHRAAADAETAAKLYFEMKKRCIPKTH